MIEVRKARAVDVPGLSASLARAFLDDPLMSWFFPEADRRARALPPLFSALLRKVMLGHDEVYTNDAVAGGALWAPPGKWRMSVGAQLRMLPEMVWLFRGRMRFTTRALAFIERHHPKEPHWYLSVLGTDPPWQGRGVGSALMAPVLDRCDQEGAAAYLESSKEQNIPFYSRYGFELRDHLDLPDGPRIWPMWRDPR